MTGVKVAGNAVMVWTGAMALAGFTAMWLARVPAPLPALAPMEQKVQTVNASGTADGRWFGMRLQDSPLVSEGLQRVHVVVREVQPGSPAAAAGVQSGDVILFIQDQLVSSTQQVADVLLGAPPEARVMLELVRSGSYVVLAMNLSRASR